MPWRHANATGRPAALDVTAAPQARDWNRLRRRGSAHRTSHHRLRGVPGTGTLIARAPLFPGPTTAREGEKMNKAELAAHIAAETSVTRAEAE